ncbi:MAG: hypothetical protein M3157_00360 [Actinomycetota bacterium]|nr:hypothetical protein [Actinomycetota bacterium]
MANQSTSGSRRVVRGYISQMRHLTKSVSQRNQKIHGTRNGASSSTQKKS